MSRLIHLTVCLALAGRGTARGEPTIDVGLHPGREVPHVGLASRSGVRVLDHRTGAMVHQTRPGPSHVVWVSASGSGLALGGQAPPGPTAARTSADVLRAVPSESGDALLIAFPWADAPGTSYRGELIVRRNGDGLLLVNRVPLETYVAAVVANEVRHTWRPEALQAIAVCARTFAVANLDRHRDDGFALCSYAHCQAYTDPGKTHPADTDAARSTAGLILTHGGAPIQAVYHACCGGRTTSNDAAWPGADPLPYLRGGWDAQDGRAFCRPAPEFEWAAELTAAELSDVLRREAEMDPGAPLTAVNVLSRDETDRALRVELVGPKRRVVAGQALWAAIRHHRGWHALPSALFWVSRDGEAFRFRGRGFGHGVGLCQWGAQGRALAGQSLADILAHYYPGTKLTRWAPARR